MEKINFMPPWSNLAQNGETRPKFDVPIDSFDIAGMSEILDIYILQEINWSTKVRILSTEMMD